MGRWWHDLVGYEVYLRSFADANGDGVGDLPGVCERLDYLAWLGVGAVWITPFYPSPMLDHGYDVADYTDVAPEFGTLADVDALVARAHELGLRLLIDLVPNHTSSAHPWFQRARSSRDDPYRDYYVWRDPAPDGGPPNNWVSHFGGPAWTFDEHTGQYWLHLFLPEQPDLNWANPVVAEEFDRILTFWLERGVDGFRIDVAHALVKDQTFPDLPVAEASDAVGMGEEASEFERLQHIYDVDQPGVLEVFRRWRRIADRYDAVLLGEVYVLTAERLRRYVADDDGLHLAFWFAPLHVPWDVERLRAVLVDGTQMLRPGGVAWVQGSHDRPRAPSRFGGGNLGRRRALALATLMFGLPGTPFVYQGEELGLENATITAADAADPIAVRAGELDRTRDVARTPMPWAPAPGLGFTTAERAWLPFGSRTPPDTVAVQREDPGSFLHRWRALIALRRGLAPQLGDAAVEWLADGGPVLAYRRGDLVVAANCGDAEETWRVEGPARVAFDNAGDDGRMVSGALPLAPAQAVILTPP